MGIDTSQQIIVVARKDWEYQNEIEDEDIAVFFYQDMDRIDEKFDGDMNQLT